MTPRTLALAAATELAVGCALATRGQASPAAKPVSNARRFMDMLLSDACSRHLNVRSWVAEAAPEGGRLPTEEVSAGRPHRGCRGRGRARIAPSPLPRRRGSC